MAKDKTNDPEALSGGSDGREPQSYGSESDWLTGKTGQTVNDTPSRTSRHDERFYENRHDQDDEVSGEPMHPMSNESRARPEGPDDAASDHTKTDENLEGRKSYFKDRDYSKD